MGLLVSLGLISLRCKKEDKPHKAAFYTSQGSISLFLLVDEAGRSKLPYLPMGAEDCNDGAALRQSLTAGSHHFRVEDSLGNTYVEGTGTFTEDGLTLAVDTGVINHFTVNTCSAIDFTY